MQVRTEDKVFLDSILFSIAVFWPTSIWSPPYGDSIRLVLYIRDGIMDLTARTTYQSVLVHAHTIYLLDRVVLDTISGYTISSIDRLSPCVNNLRAQA